MTDTDRERLTELAQRLAELDNRIEEGNEDARRSLTEAFSAFNGLARYIDPELVVPEDEDRSPNEKPSLEPC